MDILSQLRKICGEDAVIENEPLSRHTTFRVGGPAKYFLQPEKTKQLEDIILLCRETGTDYFVLGNGSNVLASDRGYEGVIISIGDKMSHIEIRDNILIAQAGGLLSAIGKGAC